MGEAARRKRLKKALDYLIPQFLSVLSLVLHRDYGFDQDRIEKVVMGMYELWEQYPGNAEALMEVCRDETGVVFKMGDADGGQG